MFLEEIKKKLPTTVIYTVFGKRIRIGPLKGLQILLLAPFYANGRRGLSGDMKLRIMGTTCYYGR